MLQASIIALNLAAKVATESPSRPQPHEAGPAAVLEGARPVSAAPEKPLMPPKVDLTGLDEQTAAEVRQVGPGCCSSAGQAQANLVDIWSGCSNPNCKARLVVGMCLFCLMVQSQSAHELLRCLARQAMQLGASLGASDDRGGPHWRCTTCHACSAGYSRQGPAGWPLNLVFSFLQWTAQGFQESLMQCSARDL